ncbi:MAG: ribosome maturation factor RimM [Gammaproteobacteria bacterium]|nr:ribosome maturation factor RimM [Gammaproteobacteria bacterium]MCW9031954.1 ribosome maturation factor RimM [Gammaproteobacteria bacterium]
MSTSDKEQQQWVPVGKVNGLFGVKGWIKVFSDTQPRENILTYSPWFLKRDGQWQEFKLLTGKAHGKGVIAHLDRCLDRDIAAELIGSEIAIKREQLPKAAPGEYYWSDLKGLKVINLESVELGHVVSMLETGANDVMVVLSNDGNDDDDELGKKGKQERLIPFVTGDTVHEVNLEQGFITVDWDADF